MLANINEQSSFSFIFPSHRKFLTAAKKGSSLSIDSHNTWKTTIYSKEKHKIPHKWADGEEK